AITEDATDDRLLDVDALDLVHLHFDRAAADEAALVNDTPIGHRDLGDEPLEPGRDQHQCSDNGQHDSDRNPERGGGNLTQRQPISETGKDENAESGEIDDPMNIGGVPHLLIRLQYALDVAHGASPSLIDPIPRL